MWRWAPTATGSFWHKCTRTLQSLHWARAFLLLFWTCSQLAKWDRVQRRELQLWYKQLSLGPAYGQWLWRTSLHLCVKVTRLGSFSGRRKQRQFWRGPSETGGRQCPPRGVSPDGGQTVSASSAWSDAAADKWREGRVHKHSKGWGLPAVGRTAGPFLLCNLCVCAVCKGRRRRQFAQGGCVRLCLRPESLYPGIGRSKRRRQVPVVLGFRPSPHHLKMGVAEVGFWPRRGIFFFFFFWCKGIRINTRIKNYAQHPLVWKESNLRLAPLPLDVPRAGQLLTPTGGCAPAPPAARSARSEPQRVPPCPGQPAAQRVDRHLTASSAVTSLLLNTFWNQGKVYTQWNM